jgi:hypothetical protein
MGVVGHSELLNCRRLVRRVDDPELAEAIAIRCDAGAETQDRLLLHQIARVLLRRLVHK